MTVALKRNVPGYVDELGRFRPIRSASYVGGKSAPRKAKAKDRKKYSRAKAGDLGKAKQERALEAPWDREYRLEQEAKAAQQRERERIEREIERDVYGETSGRTSRGKALSLAQFVRSEGGINTKKTVRKGRTRYGDSLENFTRKGSGTTGLVTTTPGKGKSLDYMHQAAREAGYDLDSMDDLLDALDNEIRSGKKTYSTHGSMTYNPAKNPKSQHLHEAILKDFLKEFDEDRSRVHDVTSHNGYGFVRMSGGREYWCKLTTRGVKKNSWRLDIRNNPAAKKNPSVHQTIYDQLGGGKFAAMTGAKMFGHTQNSLQFRLPANFASDGINFVRITLNGRDLYDVEFGKLRAGKYTVIKIDKDIYADMLRDLFTQRTGLNTSLGTMGRRNPPAKKKGGMFELSQAKADAAEKSLSHPDRLVVVWKNERSNGKGSASYGFNFQPRTFRHHVGDKFNNQFGGNKEVGYTCQVAAIYDAGENVGIYTAKRNAAKNPIRVLKHKFYVGQKLATRSIGDHDVIYRGTVVSRTPKFVTVKIDGDRELKRCGVKLYDGSEYIFPFGRYSMAPTFRAEKGDRVGNPKAKKNPDLLGMFANAAVGIASTLQIHEMTKTRKRKAAPKKRGTTTAKRRNPARSTVTRTRKNASQPNLFQSKNKHGDLYVLTIGTGDDLISVYLHDGKHDGFSKRFKTMTGAKAYATRNKVKLIQNPAAAKVNGVIKRAWARSRAASEYKRELRLEAAAERSRKRRQKAEQAARSNPRRSTSGKTAVARAANGKTAVARSAKKPTKFGASPAYAVQLFNGDGHFFYGITVLAKTAASAKSKAIGLAKREFAIPASVKVKTTKVNPTTPAKSSAKRKNPKSEIRNPQSTARRRTFEMFQGRKATTARPMAVSRHAPARLDQLGDLVELKIAGGETIKFNGRGTKLCAAAGRLWIAGKRFAKPNPAAAANEINPIGEIDHIVYGTYKPHHGDHNYTHYIHKLGEESGVMPTLCVDREGYPVIRGGNYKIEARGIVD